MFVTADQKSLWYKPELIGHIYVEVDGVEIEDCVEANDFLGYAKVYVRNEKGHLVLDEKKLEAKTRTIYGEIRIGYF